MKYLIIKIYFLLQIVPQPVSELEFSAPSRSEKNRSTKKKLLSDVPSLTSSQITMAIEQLKDISPNCMFFATQPRSQSDTESASENGDDDTTSVPELLTTLYNPRIKSERDSEKKEMMMKQVFEEYYVSATQISNLCHMTKLQGCSPLWHAHRTGRITASIAHRILTMRDSTCPAKLVRQIMGYQANTCFVPSIAWGTENEKKARDAYLELIRSTNVHKNLKVETTGLHVSQDFPHLGASPDGIISCDCCRPKILEIKCPFSCKDSGIKTKIGQKDCFLIEGPQLKVQHQYYTKVQFQMFITGYEQCDFVTYTNVDIEITTVKYNKIFCDNMIKKVNKFFEKYVLPELCQRNLSDGY